MRCSRYARIPLALLLIPGGIFGLLPVPCLDAAARTPFVRAARAGAAGPMARMLGWIERKWIERHRTKTMH